MEIKVLVVSLDVKKDIWGQYKLYSHLNNKKIKLDFVSVYKENGESWSWRNHC